MLLLAILALAACGATIGLVLWAAALPRSQAAARVHQIGAYGFRARLAGIPGAMPAKRPGGRPLIALATRLGNLIAGQVGPVREEKLRSELLAAGIYGLAPRALLGFGVLGALMLGVLALVYDVQSPVLKVGLIALGVRFGWGLPLFAVRRRARTRLQAIDRTLPDLIDLLVVTVEAGLGFSGSLQVAAERMDGPLGDELRLTMQEQRMGRALKEALEQMLVRAETPSMRSFVRSIVQGETLGVSIGDIMRNLATEMRKRRRAAAEERAQKAPIKILFPLIFLIFPAMFVVLLGPALFSFLEAIKGAQ
jgi:tight adherence protein C